ncbi:MAG: hypothetical protein MJ094_04455 [Saccharofermentans sp.]|nr:hypothetical protein [Saccharofermentans sp.]
MFRDALFTKMKNNRIIYPIIAVLIALFTVICIKWPDKSKPLGDEYSCHIYSQNKFYQFFPMKFDDHYVLKRGMDTVFDCEWNFVYDDEAGAYDLYTVYGNESIYVTLNDNNELELTDSCVDNTDRWNLIKIGNSQFYAIVNASSDYAIRFIEGGQGDFGSAAIFDIDNFEFWMRLQ